MKRLPSREPAVTAVQICGDARLLGEGGRALHEHPADAVAAERRRDVRGQHLHGEVEVERGDGRDLEQDRAGRLAVVLGDDQALLGRRRGRLDDLLEVGDVLLRLGAAQGADHSSARKGASLISAARSVTSERVTACLLVPDRAPPTGPRVAVEHYAQGARRDRGVPGFVFPGIGTVVNVATVLLGALLGRLLGDRLPERTRDLVTDGLGLVTLLIAATSAMAVLDPALAEEVGDSAPMLIVLGSVLVGGIVGSLLRLESRVEGLGGVAAAPPGRRRDSAERQRFIEGFVVASLIFCTGPLTILGSLDDGLGNGADQLFLKATLDGFAAIAFAASFGWGVAASAVTIVVVQGSLTVLGFALGDVLPDAHLAADHRDRRPAARRGRPPPAAHPRDRGRRPAAGAAGGPPPDDPRGGAAGMTAGAGPPGPACTLLHNETATNRTLRRSDPRGGPRPTTFPPTPPSARGSRENRRTDEPHHQGTPPPHRRGGRRQPARPDRVRWRGRQRAERY